MCEHTGQRFTVDTARSKDDSDVVVNFSICTEIGDDRVMQILYQVFTYSITSRILGKVVCKTDDLSTALAAWNDFVSPDDMLFEPPYAME